MNTRHSRYFIPVLCIALLITWIVVTQQSHADKKEKTTQKTSWSRVDVPASWKAPLRGKLAPQKGMSWFRALVKVPTSWKGKEIHLQVEPVDDARQIYFNGRQVGSLGTFLPNYRSGLSEKGRFSLPAESIKFGEVNLISIRCYYEDGRTNFRVAAPALFVKGEGIKMEGTWQYRPGDNKQWQGSTEGVNKNQVYSKIEKIDDLEKYLRKRKGDNDALSPAEALKQFVVPDDLKVELVLSEPVIKQPLFMSFDERGRMWVLQYLQYPNPAGLKVISRDKHLRAVYDKVPKAPPNHVKGQDKITIHEDTNGDGIFDKHKTFVDGLNITSSFAKGRGGVWVLNPPYLLFYPDKNNDDIPDGDPVVHLSGFGMEDTHSIANSLRWGPDGWLYAAQGSTVTGNIIRPGIDKKPIRSMGQLIWRYHPEQKIYEIFAEGGGNTFGVEFDATGSLFSGHNGGDTRGFHYVQGAYLRKGFNKHGSLSNPYAFGYFPHIKHHSVARFSHNFVIYEEGVLPKRYHGKLFGIEPLQGQVVQSDFKALGSTFETKDINRPLKTDDQWFRPVDIKTGPDGAIYVADMYEQRIDHSSHYAGRVTKNDGRIYRLVAKNDKHRRSAKFDYGKLTSLQLVELLSHPSKWHRQMALQQIADRKDASLIPILKKIISKEKGQTALEALWALNLSRGLTDGAALSLLDHINPHVRLWTVRLLCDKKYVAPDISYKLAKLAVKEADVRVRSQLACSAKRIPVKDALPIIRALLRHDEDATEARMPLLIWWAMEAKATENADAVVTMFANKEVWEHPIVKEHLSERLIRRFALSGKRIDLVNCAKLLNHAPSREYAKVLMTGFEKAFQGRSLARLPDELVQAIAKSGGASDGLKLRQGDKQTIATALKLLVNPKANKQKQIQFVQIFGQINQPACVPVLLNLVRNSQDTHLQSAVLVALQSYNKPEIGKSITAIHNNFKGDTLTVAQTLLASRKSWAIELLDAIDNGNIKKETVPMEIVRKFLLHHDQQIQTLVKKHYGDVSGATTDQMREQIASLEKVISHGSGNPYSGKKLFMQTCGKCHTLFEKGGQIGPNLTSYKRDDLSRMLLNIVNPSAEIREGFENYVVVTLDGRVVNGFLADKDNKVIVIRGVDGKNIIIPRDNVDEMSAIPRSVMPVGALDKLTKRQIRDLFAYLRAAQPLP